MILGASTYILSVLGGLQVSATIRRNTAYLEDTKNPILRDGASHVYNLREDRWFKVYKKHC
jgi:hypothetical protein